MITEEDVTDYMIRAERSATGLRAAGEQITDNLIIAMILKGLPESYKPFVIVHTHLDNCKTLTEFKAALNTFANTEALRSPRPISAMNSKTLHMAQKSTQNAQRHYNVFHVEKWDISHGIADLSRNYDAINDLPRPSSKQELRRFLGMAGFYRAFIKDFAAISQPLNHLVGNLP